MIESTTETTTETSTPGTTSPPGLRERPRFNWAALAAVVLLGGLAVQAGAGCGDDETTPTNRNRFEAGVITGDAGEDADPMAGCPESPPRVGETCPGIPENRATCTYKVGTCVQPNGSTYDETVDFCCVRGGNWDQCGANTTPCDEQPPSTEPDAGVVNEAGVDAAETGIDAAAD
jgi:hypothetical protein